MSEWVTLIYFLGNLKRESLNRKNRNDMKEDKGQILLYQTPDGESRIEVTLQGETVWLSLDQMAELFQRNKSTISRHIKNVFEEGELNKDMVVAKFATTTQHGAIEGKTQSHMVDFYNLDMIRCTERFHGPDYLDWCITQEGRRRDCQKLSLSRGDINTKPYRQPLSRLCRTSGRGAPTYVYERLDCDS